MFDTQLHLWAVLLGVVAHLLIGWIWYGPLFGKKWMALVGKTMEDVGSPMKAMLLGLVTALFKSYFLDRAVTAIGADSIGAAIMVAFWLWFGFVLMVELLKVFYEGRNTTLVTLDVGYQLAWFIVTGAIVGAFI